MLRRALQAVLFVANLALVSAWLSVGQGETVQPLSGEGLPSAVGVIVWWSSPALTLFLHRTWAGTLLTGGALLLGSGVALTSIYANTSATAAIGFYTLPVLGWLMAMAVLIAEWVFRQPWWP